MPEKKFCMADNSTLTVKSSGFSTAIDEIIQKLRLSIYLQ